MVKYRIIESWYNNITITLCSLSLLVINLQQTIMNNFDPYWLFQVSNLQHQGPILVLVCSLLLLHLLDVLLQYCKMFQHASSLLWSGILGLSHLSSWIVNARQT